MAYIWECSANGIRTYFDIEAEAKFFHEDTAKAGIAVKTQPVPWPSNPKQFAAFMNEYFSTIRRVVLAAHALADD